MPSYSVTGDLLVLSRHPSPLDFHDSPCGSVAQHVLKLDEASRPGMLCHAAFDVLMGR
jgi:hypothetical protein